MPMRYTPVRCTPVRYTPMRHTPIRCTLVGCMPVRYVLIFENSFVVLAPPSPLCTTISNLLPPLRPLHTTLSSPEHSHAFCHAGLNRRPGHHPPGRASSSPAKAV